MKTLEQTRANFMKAQEDTELTNSPVISHNNDKTHYILEPEAMLRQNPTTIDQGTTIRIEKN